jgi:hypothetical protein
MVWRPRGGQGAAFYETNPTVPDASQEHVILASSLMILHFMLMLLMLMIVLDLTDLFDSYGSVKNHRP